MKHAERKEEVRKLIKKSIPEKSALPVAEQAHRIQEIHH
jgi:hypothetical protein